MKNCLAQRAAILFNLLFFCSVNYAAIDWVGNMFPASGSSNSIAEGAGLTIYVQTFKSGVTEPAGQGAGISCEIYYGSVPAFGQPWTSIFTQAMSYNVDIGNNDEYVGTITPPAGLYEFTCRCSDDGGASWLFAVLPAGNGLLTVQMALAVDLMHFEAESTATEIQLNWSTSLEQNNSHFEIERSADSHHWEMIGQINGQGNSTVKQDYIFEDKAPLNGMNYYRLKQIDLFGDHSLSKVIAVENDEQAQWLLYPNPVSQQLYLQQIANKEQLPKNYLIRIFDAKGLLVRSLQKEGIETTEIDLSDLQNGLYFISITDRSNLSAIFGKRILKE